MCGITGALWFEPTAAVSQIMLDTMTDMIAHRGPDDRGTFLQAWQRDVTGITPGVALGFRRLSIIDLAGGHQPMTNEDGTVTIVFNGEIYNYQELRRRLEGSATAFAPTAIPRPLFISMRISVPNAFQPSTACLRLPFGIKRDVSWFWAAIAWAKNRSSIRQRPSKFSLVAN